MYVRMAYWKCRAEHWGEDSRLLEKDAFPIMRGHSGFVRSMLLGTPGGPQRVTFTIWANRVSYDRFMDSPDLDRITDMFSHMYLPGGHPDPVEYEVRARSPSARSYAGRAGLQESSSDISSADPATDSCRYVRMAYWKCRAEHWGEDSRLFEGAAVPIMRGHSGFVRAMLLGTPADPQRIAFTVWASRVSYGRFVDSPDLGRITDMFSHMYLPGGNPDPVEYEIRTEGAPASASAKDH